MKVLDFVQSGGPDRTVDSTIPDIWQRDYPKLQLRTIADLLANNPFEVPQHASMYQPAQRVQRTQGRQAAFDQAMAPGA